MIIKNGIVYDPLNEIHGERMDIFVERGKIVEKAKGEVIDASSLIVMPGGVDIHSHIVGSKVNYGRQLRPEDHREHVMRKTRITRSGTGYTIPTTFFQGYKYAQMGYTSVFEAACPPLGAKHAHEELQDTPIIDKGMWILMGSNYFVLRYVENNEFSKLKEFVSWLLKATKGYVIKIVNPGGVENWKWGKNVTSLDETIENFRVTPREILSNLERVCEELKLPHPIHVHCNNLGHPGNFETTIETMENARKRIHITHIQFNSYAGEDWMSFESGASDVTKFINKSKRVTCDVGQVIFGEATTMTADGPWQHTLHKLTKNKWINADVELETGAGIVPYKFKRKNMVNAIQWAIGLEIFLLVKDPFKVFLTTDHPNAGPFYHYPKVIALLMSKREREKELSKVHQAAKEKTTLESMDREYTLSEIVIITRSGTAKSLGLKNKGHLGVGADADISIYDFSEDDIENSFSKAKYVLKDGNIVVKDGEIVKDYLGKTYWVDTEGSATDEVRKLFEKYYTVNFENYPVFDEYLKRQEVIQCK
ncbi:MAG: formylmethanofuran dehydrogenase subunit A [Candidatus Methanofastidiosia archaeon]